MNHSNYCSRRARASHLVFGLACASLASACSGYYPLGETSQPEDLVDGEGPALRGPTGDARVPATLAPPDFTINAPNDGVGYRTLASVGDMDGDGRDEMAAASRDDTTGLSFVQLRYGGPRPSGAEEVFAFEHGGARLVVGNDVTNTLFVARAGDVDGDGYDDLLLETDECAAIDPRDGTYLIYGGPERLEGVVPLTSLAVHFAPPFREPFQTQYMSCESYRHAQGAGDIDGDGLDDILITSAPLLGLDGSPEPGTGEGVYVFYGRPQRFSGEVPFTGADASFHVDFPVNPYALGDIDGDGLADLMMAADVYAKKPIGSFLVPGRAERWGGALDLAASGTLLEGAYVDSHIQVHTSGDLDGDGLDDVLLRSADGTRHLFYGASDLFAAGVDFAAADATIGGIAVDVYAAGDLDGDGDAELLDQFSNPDSAIAMGFDFLSSNIAMASGTRERLSSAFGFAETEVLAQAPDGFFGDLGRFGTSGRTLTTAIPAGDLDGDGADDLFTTSYHFEIFDGSNFGQTAPQVHVHYGTPAALTTPLR